MDIIYKELTTEEHFLQCLKLQERSFHLSDIEKIPVIFMRCIARKMPVVGLLIGAFKIKNMQEVLIGFHLAITTSEKGALYGMMTAIEPDYQNKTYGFNLIKHLISVALKNKFTKYYTLFDPLESNLGRLYLSKFGFKGIKYIPSAYEIENDKFNIPNDKIYVIWNLLAVETQQKLNNCFQSPSFIEYIKNIELIGDSLDINKDKYLFEIPFNYINLKNTNPESALKTRLESQNVFNYYLNEKGYILSQCITGKLDGKRRCFYLFENKQ